MRGRGLFLSLALLLSAAVPAAAGWFDMTPHPRLVLFVGVDVSGSFLRGKDFDSSLGFLSRYLYAHLNGLAGLDKPAALFVGSIGGDKAGQPKVFYPIETFQNKSPAEIEAELHKLFPATREDPYTDFNAFFGKVEQMVKDRGLILRPLSIVLLSDGQLDVPDKQGRYNYRNINVRPLGKLSRNVTIRLLYTSPSVGKKWEDRIPRRRVEIWTQEAPVMETWQDPNIFVPGQPLDKQALFLKWVKDNVDYGVRLKRVD